MEEGRHGTPIFFGPHLWIDRRRSGARGKCASSPAGADFRATTHPDLAGRRGRRYRDTGRNRSHQARTGALGPSRSRPSLGLAPPPPLGLASPTLGLAPPALGMASPSLAPPALASSSLVVMRLASDCLLPSRAGLPPSLELRRSSERVARRRLGRDGSCASTFYFPHQDTKTWMAGP